MKIVYFYVDGRNKEEKLKRNLKLGLNIAIMTLIILHSPTAATAFKSGTVYQLINAIPMPH